MTAESTQLFDSLHRLYVKQLAEDAEGAERHIELKSSQILFVSLEVAQKLHRSYHS